MTGAPGVERATATDPRVAERVRAAGAALAGPLAAEPLRRPAGRLGEYGWGRSLLAAGDSARRAAVLWSHREACRGGRDPAAELGRVLVRGRLAWTAAELRWAFAVLWAGAPAPGQHAVLLAAAEQVPPSDRGALQDDLRRLLHGPQPAGRFRNRVRALVGSAGAPVDRFVVAARDELAAAADDPATAALLAHCGTAHVARPPDRWADTAARLAAAPGAVALRRALLRRFVELAERPDEPGPRLHADSEVLLRGVLWTATGVAERWVEPLLGRVALTAVPRAVPLAGAAVAALAGRPGPASLAVLAVLHERARHPALLDAVRAAVDEAAAVRGLTRAQLLERSVPDHGLDAAGRREVPLGEHVAVLTAAPVPALHFRTADGVERAAAPAAVREQHGAALARLRGTVAGLGRCVDDQSRRLESLLAEGRVWERAEWERWCRDHPVVGPLARTLVWELERAPGRWVTGLPDGDGFRDADGGAVRGRAARLRLWHPATAPADRADGWRRAVLLGGVHQPFPQVFRGVYGAAAVDRFTGQVLRAPRAAALLAERGWVGDPAERAQREFDGWTADLRWALLRGGSWPGRGADGTPLARTGPVRFRRTRPAAGPAAVAGRPAAAADVPPRVFAEALRDVDLALDVAGCAPGPLTPLGLMRREALLHLVPRTPLARRCEVGDPFLTVRGRARTYRIHLGSGDVLLDDAPLGDLLPGVRSAGPHLDPPPPFEARGALASILSTALLLADDAAAGDAGPRARIADRDGRP